MVAKTLFSICHRLSHRYEFIYAAICPRVNKPCFMFFKNLPLSFSFAESTALRLQVNCKTFFVVILNGICVLAINIRVKTLRENYSCNGATAEYPATLYHHCFRWSAFFEERSITQHREPRITTAYWKPNYKDLYGNLS